MPKQKAGGASSAGSGAGSSKPLPVAARLAQERVAKLKAEEEQKAREAEEAARREAELKAQEEEEERKRLEAKEKRKAKERKKKAEADKRRAEEETALALQRLGVAVPPSDSSPSRPAAEAASPNGGQPKRGTASLYVGKKKKKEQRKPGADGAADDASGASRHGESSEDAAVETPATDSGAAEDWESAADTWDAKDQAEEVAATPTPIATPAVVARSLEERIADSRARRTARYDQAFAARSGDRLRSPICVVLGHVDTGKTSLLDKIRKTNVQEGEAGGITQQIGATYFPMDRLRLATDKLNHDLRLDYKIPGLLVIDTPGHESFTNLRSRGTSLCDIAVLVVDIMHGLERQTIESIGILRSRRTPFVVAFNKIDRMYGWKPTPNAPVRETLAAQSDNVLSEFDTRARGVLLELAQQGLNAKLYYENDDFKRNVSVVPTSAVTGEGVPDLLMLIVTLTQQMMEARLKYVDYAQATILEVKTIDGLGTTVDAVLVNGELHEGDTIVVCGMEGPIVTQIRALLTPPPLREMRVKSEYVHHKKVEAAMGVKISAQGLEKAVAGTSLLVAAPDDEVEDLKQEVMEDFDKIMKGFKREPVGVYVQASTLGSLEALLEYLRTHEPPVPVANVGLGPLHKKDIVQASVMLEHKKEFATILAFDVKVTADAAKVAEELGVKIFCADIIYHLTDQFDAYLKSITEARLKESIAEAVFPAILKIIPTAIFNARDPIVIGVDVIEGKLKVGTPLCVVLPEGTKRPGADEPATVAVKAQPAILDIGRVTSIEHNHAPRESAEAGGPSVAIKISPGEGQQNILYGRQFDHTYPLYAHVTRESINILKESFRDQLSKADWKAVIKLKEKLGVD